MKKIIGLLLLALFLYACSDGPMKTIKAVDPDAFSEEMADSLTRALDSLDHVDTIR